MPPLPRIRNEALSDLADGLRYAPREALLRDIDRAEALAGEVDAETGYPAEWVLYRVTGYRPDLGEARLIPGAELLADLSALVERLCHAAGLTDADIEGSHEGADELAARWNVSRKTLDRWRRQGLIARRVHDEGGRTRLRFTAHASETFARRREDLLGRASGFSRIESETAQRMVRRARRYHDLLGCTLNQAADRLGRRYGRSREAVRQLLHRHDQRARAGGGAPIFGEPRALSERTQRAIERAWRRGIEPGEMVRRYDRTRGAIHRIVHEQRLRRLRALDLGRISPEASGLDEGSLAAILGAAPVQRVEPPTAPADLKLLLSLMRERVVPVGVEERAWSRAEHALRARAAAIIAALPPGQPEAQSIDRAETDLRWAAALRAPLARTQMRLVIETLESSLGVDLGRMHSRDARAIIEAGLGALRAGLDAYDAWKSGRLAAPVGMAAAKLRPPAGRGGADPRRAQVVLLPGAPAPDWTLLVSPWSAPLRPDPRLSQARGDIEPDLALILTRRFGLDGERPHTLVEIASERRTTVMHAGRLECRALRAALAAARARGG